ncbi:MAG: DUF1501 domain-containing protein [Verrucomicrobiota bacterium]
MNLSRRQFLKTGCLTFGALGVTPFSSSLLQRELLAGNVDSDKKLIFIFQNGGNDGINTLIPTGDPDYNTNTRPTLYIPSNVAIDSGNGFAQFHPKLQPMMEIFNKTTLNGQAGPGNLAVLHRIGYSSQSQSHFDSEQYWQNGVPGSKLEEGFFYRHITKTVDLSNQSNAFVAAAISSSQMVALKGDQPIPNFVRASDFAFAGAPAKSQKFLGKAPTTANGTDGSGLLGLYGSSPDSVSKPYRPLIYQTGQLLGATINTLQGAVALGNYAPENGAAYPKNGFGDKLQQAAMLLKRTPVKVIGMNIGGWDTHTNQGQINGSQGDLLYNLALGFQAIHRDLQLQWDKLIVVTMTEFGRTSKENGSGGTDHADSSVMFVAGGGVKGGVYNCDSIRWKQGDMFTKDSRYLSRKTDFRAVFGEIFTHHFGDSEALLDEIIPGYSASATKDPNSFQRLNFIA